MNLRQRQPLTCLLIILLLVVVSVVIILIWADMDAAEEERRNRDLLPSSQNYQHFEVKQWGAEHLLHLFRNSQQLEQVVLMPSIEANVWYVLELAVDDGAGFRASVWKASEAGTRTEMRYEMPRTSGWRFHLWSGSALTSLDTYSEATLNLGTGTTRIVGKHFEYDATLNRQYKRYYANGQLLATRVTQFGCPGCDELAYVQGDHLGSSSTLTNGIGGVVARERYSAFGERRKGESYLITDQLYTGQRLNVLSNLYHYSDGLSYFSVVA
ncbi:MAG: hypothetical protein KIS91_14110 [Anaerolineae bacterium]|nr:hypothetical protein [Anaerolineae bacterium]